MNPPHITVLMPVFNLENYIEEAISSILNQTYSDFELLIINDGSMDKTEKKILSFKDKRIRYIKNEKNLGLCKTLNIGVKLSKGIYIARMDGDDVCMSDRLEKQVKILEENENIGICGASYKFIGNKNSIMIQPEKHEEITVGFLFGCTLTLPLFRKSLFLENGLKYQSEYFPAEDYKMWADCSLITEIYNIQDILFHYRSHDIQVSTDKRIWQQKKSDKIRLEMLTHLFPDFSQDEKQYHINYFVPGIVESKEDIKQFKSWATSLILRNSQLSNYNDRELRKKITLHTQSTILKWIQKDFFHSEKTAILNIWKFLLSGLWLRVPFGKTVKMIIKYTIKS